ncbi:hypothetical protein RvY_13169 [Ramazzottius varieornatus]|uniref:Protein KRI1 homolog n=1 Tax=Ramazzottius varieornatus TaxID=947166 RepID=A0A1D1VVJ8_RAMVA|nr:hypothetical protein RvY_13169 [Ramazzottius varieornatus]
MNNKGANRLLLDSGDEDDEKIEFNENSGYAKRYDDWREKEEMQKLRDRYGDDVKEDDEDESTSESEDEDAEALTPQIERDFFKTLAYLKSGDADLSDKTKTFFKQEEDSPTDDLTDVPSTSRSKKPMFLKDYERKIIMESNGVIEESKDTVPAKYQATYSQEQDEVKRSLARLAHDDDEDDDLLVERKRTEDERKQEEETYAEWLRSQSGTDKSEKHAELKPLKQFWTDPKLDEDEEFLRDYLLDKKYLYKDAKRIPTYGEIVNDEHFSEEEEELEKAEEFEHKYNFRFEEPDPDFIKRYPRTLDDSLRRKDDSRKFKRDEIKERKEAEKKRMKQDIDRLNYLKKKEIEKKIDRLKSITGNEYLQLGDADIEGDFDPEKHDSMMKKAFDDEYYEGEEEMEPPDISDESDIDENWLEEKTLEDEDEDEDGQAPRTSKDKPEDTERSSKAEGTGGADEVRRLKKSRRQTKVSEAVQKQKPAFDPNEKKLEEYLDEYYKLDFEDIVAGAPTRFRYRSVVPNDFGLSIDEILVAPDRELNAWCTLKKTVQYRREEEEMYDVRTYKQKGSLKDLKYKIILTLAEMQAGTSGMSGAPSASTNGLPNTSNKTPEAGKGKRKRRKKKKTEDPQKPDTEQNGEQAEVDETTEEPGVKERTENSVVVAATEKKENGGEVSKSAKKKRRGEQRELDQPTEEAQAKPDDERKVVNGDTTDKSGKLSRNQKRRLQRKRKLEAERAGRDGISVEGVAKPPPQKKAKTAKGSYDHEQFLKGLPSAKISDERLKAYGLQPKKFRAKEKYVLMAKAKASAETSPKEAQ